MMDAEARRARQLFEGSYRFYVPAYQRPYVWEQDRQWQPLWEDVERLADARLDEREELHFLGAVVLRQERSAPGGLSEWSVIDGQQRLTTLQIMFSAMALAAEADGVKSEAKRLRKLTLHDPDDAEGDQRFRFWPTNVNQAAYREVISEPSAGSTSASSDDEQSAEVLEDDPNNTIHEAFQFFYGQARDYANREDDLLTERWDDQDPVELRYGALREATGDMIQVVAIQLEKDDPAQTIFETLNARGTPLLSTDLIKNALFAKVESCGGDLDQVNQELWMPGLGDYEYWAQEERLGRITVPRSEGFLMHWLTMKTGEIVPSDKLFDRFRKEFLDADPGADASAEEQLTQTLDLLEELKSDAQIVRGYETLDPHSAAGRYLSSARIADITALHPLLLALLRNPDIPQPVRDKCLEIMESFIVRRMVMRYQSEGYNKAVGELIKKIQAQPDKADEVLTVYLMSSESRSLSWPRDEEIQSQISNQPFYGAMGRSRLLGLLSQLELSERNSSKTEQLSSLPDKLQIEHILPQSWKKNWPLEEGFSPEDEAERERHVNLLGNLTLVAGSLNASMSNAAWPEKRKALNKHSVLLMNKTLEQIEDWDEQQIAERGRQLATRIAERFPGPQSFLPEGVDAPDYEQAPDNVITDRQLLEEVFNGCSALLRDLLIDLSQHPSEKRSYHDIEASLDWPHRRLSGVFGGYSASKLGRGRRPFHIKFASDGSWYMWMDEQTAEWVKELSSTADQDLVAQLDTSRARLKSEDIQSVFDYLREHQEHRSSIRSELLARNQNPDSTTIDLGLQLSTTSGAGASGYFAKNWLFLWWKSLAGGQEEFFRARLSAPDEVYVDKNGNLRLHVKNLDDLQVVFDALEQDE